MSKPQYEFFHFEKYKRPAVSKIESHHECTKEKYASNPDIDPERKNRNYHLIEPADRYNAIISQQVKESGCRTRKDSVWMMKAFFTASPEFFKGKKKREIREFFEECIKFLEKHQSRETFISAVVHMDETTPHTHLSFVPFTKDKHLAAKTITGNRKKLTWWQDTFWEHIVQKYPEIERGKSASETHRKHIPPRLFKEMTRLTKQKEKLQPFEGHPFQVKDDDEMEQLVWSILTQGMLAPIVARPLKNGEYEVISGHRRLHACQKAEIATVPALIYALDRDAAAIALVDSNLHREKILPSEKAFAYKLKMDAMSHQGTSCQVGTKLRSDEMIGSASGESA